MSEQVQIETADLETVSGVPGASESASASELDTPPDLVLIGGACQVKGQIRNCRRLEIEGVLEGDLETEEIFVRQGGNINGQIKTTNAEIHGVIEGDLVVENLLDVRDTGFVSGDLNYGQLAVATGGQITGNLKQTPNEHHEKSPRPSRPALVQHDDEIPSITKIIDGLMHGNKKPDHSSESITKGKTPADLVLIGGTCQVNGEIRNCRRLVIEGVLEGDLETEEIIVRKGGRINGHIKTINAEIHGDIQGDLVVENLLDVRSTGVVSGDVSYGELIVASGGHLVGNMRQTPKEDIATNGKRRNASIESNGNGENAPSISEIIDGLRHSREF